MSSNTYYPIDLSTVRAVHIDDTGEPIHIEEGSFTIRPAVFLVADAVGGRSAWQYGGDWNPLWFHCRTHVGSQWSGPLDQVKSLIHSTDVTPKD